MCAPPRMKHCNLKVAVKDVSNAFFLYTVYLSLSLSSPIPSLSAMLYFPLSLTLFNDKPPDVMPNPQIFSLLITDVLKVEEPSKCQ